MSKTWLCSDHHLGHSNIIKFMDDKGNRIRPFSSIEEHDETIIANHNALVSPQDRVYFMGDVVIRRSSLPLISRMNGRKKLIKGNHDIFKLRDYQEYFEDILSYRIYPDSGIIVSHIPVHPSNLERRFKLNLHGHTHINVLEDTRYKNLCLEHTDFKPVNLQEILDNVQ